MRILTLAFLIFSFHVSAQTVPLPPAVSSVDDMVNEFRNIFTTKLGEMGKNFITKMSAKTVIFTNSSVVSCNGAKIAKGDPLSIMQYNFVKTNSELIEKAVYTGCSGQISLVEDVVTRGSKLEPLKYSDFIKGKRTFELNPDETYRLYRISNAENEEIFKMLIEKKETSKVVELYFLDQKFLRMNYEFSETSTRLTLTFYGYNANYIRKHGQWSYNSTFDPFTNTVLVKKGIINQASYYDLNGSPLSQTDYLAHFDKRITSGPLSVIRSIIEYHNYYFPTTAVVQTGSKNQRLKEELRLLFNRLQNNTELNLVKKQVQDYIEAVENGLINDNRPKE